jgi:hypothetical protein
MAHTKACPSLDLQIRVRFRPVSLSLSMLRAYPRLALGYSARLNRLVVDKRSSLYCRSVCSWKVCFGYSNGVVTLSLTNLRRNNLTFLPLCSMSWRHSKVNRLLLVKNTQGRLCLTQKIRPSRRNLPGANALAYFAGALDDEEMKKNRFFTLTPGQRLPGRLILRSPH